MAMSSANGQWEKLLPQAKSLGFSVDNRNKKGKNFSALGAGDKVRVLNAYINNRKSSGGVKHRQIWDKRPKMAVWRSVPGTEADSASIDAGLACDSFMVNIPNVVGIAKIHLAFTILPIQGETAKSYGVVKFMKAQMGVRDDELKLKLASSPYPGFELKVGDGHYEVDFRPNLISSEQLLANYCFGVVGQVVPANTKWFYYKLWYRTTSIATSRPSKVGRGVTTQL